MLETLEEEYALDEAATVEALVLTDLLELPSTDARVLDFGDEELEIDLGGDGDEDGAD